jgi:hypothetical protein
MHTSSVPQHEDTTQKMVNNAAARGRAAESAVEFSGFVCFSNRFGNDFTSTEASLTVDLLKLARNEHMAQTTDSVHRRMH